MKEFEASQRREPNRFRNYAASARVADMAGDRAKAAAYYQKLVLPCEELKDLERAIAEYRGRK